MIDNMVDYNDNSVVYQGAELALLLLGTFRTLVDDAHQQLAAAGFADATPSHGFTLQALGTGATAADLAERLGVSKQAVAKTITRLETGGYVTRAADTGDSRRKLITPTPRAAAFLAESVAAFNEVVSRWRLDAGADNVDRLLAVLRTINGDKPIPWDFGSWSG